MITHELLHPGWWYFVRTCTSTTSRTLLNFKVKGQGHFFVSGQKFTNLFSPNVEKLVDHYAFFRLSIARSVPEIFAIKVYSCPKSIALLLTHEPLHLAWRNFARICTSATSRTLLNFKVIGQRSRSHGFGCFSRVWCCGYLRTVLSLEQGLMMLLIFVHAVCSVSVLSCLSLLLSVIIWLWGGYCDADVFAGWSTVGQSWPTRSVDATCNQVTAFKLLLSFSLLYLTCGMAPDLTSISKYAEF